MMSDKYSGSCVKNHENGGVRSRKHTPKIGETTLDRCRREGADGILTIHMMDV